MSRRLVMYRMYRRLDSVHLYAIVEVWGQDVAAQTGPDQVAQMGRYPRRDSDSLLLPVVLCVY